MTKMRPAQINQVAGELLRSTAFLNVLPRIATSEELPAIPLTLTDQKNVDWFQFKGPRPVFFTEGALFGWLYVCFVWLREADEPLFDRAVEDPEFTAEWTPFLAHRLCDWAPKKPKALEHMLEHFRHAIAHGNIFLNYDEGIERGYPARIYLTSKDPKTRRTVARFKASFTDLALFGEAVYHAHTAEVNNVPYGTFTLRRRKLITVIKSEPVVTNEP